MSTINADGTTQVINIFNVAGTVYFLHPKITQQHRYTHAVLLQVILNTLHMKLRIQSNMVMVY